MRVSFPYAGRAGRSVAFTLIEMLVVVIIIGILAGIGLPALKGYGKSNAITAADRQILDDLANARQMAIADHTDVYMVFMFPTNSTFIDKSTAAYPSTDPNTPNILGIVTNLLGMQYTAYALFSQRSVGDQPGQSSPQYLTPWRQLPNGMIFPATKFTNNVTFYNVTNGNLPNGVGVSIFQTNAFPFPVVNSNTVAHPVFLPYVQFNYQGQVVNPRDLYNSSEIIPMARGSIMTNADLSVDLLEAPFGNSTNLPNIVRIDWLTGRAKIEQSSIR